MKYHVVFISVLLCSTMSSVFCQDKPQTKKIGVPTFTLQGGGTGKDLRNFQGTFNAGVKTKVWEKKDKSLVLGVNYGQDIARFNGHTFKSKPDFGVAATYYFGRKK